MMAASPVQFVAPATRTGRAVESVCFDYAVYATLFLSLNALLLRTLHHHFDAAYDNAAVCASIASQQGFLVGGSAFAFASLHLTRRDSIVQLCAIVSTPLVLVMWV